MPWKKDKNGDWFFKLKWQNVKLQEALDEMLSWLPSEQRSYQEFICKVIASLPGGDQLEDLGYEPFDFLGWKEMSLLENLLHGINDKQDVEQVAEALIGPYEDEE